MNRNALDDERGFAVIIAIVVMTLMFGLGLVALKLADTQQKGTKKDRERESSLNLAEGVLYSQAFILSLPPSGAATSEGWPSASTKAYTTCSQATGGVQCPDNARLATSGSAAASFANVDVNSPTTAWTSEIMDNGVTPSNNFADAQSPAVRYDANGDKKVWVKASATVRSRTRTVVGLMQLEQLTLPFPRFVVQSYSLNLKDKPGAVNTNGGGAVHLGCSGYGSGCANWDPNGGAVVGGTQFGFGSNLQALTDSQQAALKTAAKTEGHYCEIPGNASDTNSLSPGFTCTAAGCPVEIGNTTGSGDGWIVWADGPTGQCKYNGGTNYNSLAKPGMLVIGQGPGWIEVTGNATFYGVLYAVNRQKVSTPALLQWHGNGSMVGAAASDFNGSIDMCCSSQADFTFDANALKGVKVNGTAGLAQNTWREL